MVPLLISPVNLASSVDPNAVSLPGIHHLYLNKLTSLYSLLDDSVEWNSLNPHMRLLQPLTSITAAYSASNAAVIAMTRGDAIDYAKHGIRVNCICPGIIETPMTTFDARVKQMLTEAADIAPMKRMGRPEEVADCAIFLCSPKASFVQGASLVVDGGYTIN